MHPLTDNPRLLAAETIYKIKHEGAYANIATNEALNINKLSRLDSSLVTDLVNGTIRYMRLLDEIIQLRMDRTLSKIEERLLIVLEISAYSSVIRSKPEHAVVNEGVDLARRFVGERATKYTNAVLRKIVAKNLSEWKEEIANKFDESAVQAILNSIPDWIYEVFDEQINDRAELQTFLDSINVAPVTTFAKLPFARAKSMNLELGTWSPFAFIERERGEIKNSLNRNNLIVQDEGSQLVSIAFLAATLNGQDKNWLDMTAGPGGKAAFLAAAAKARHAKLVANEIYPHRAELIRNTFSRLNLQGEVQVADALTATWPNQFDRVLLDAPCSGLGALRRRAEARWRKQPSDIVELVDLQKRLLSKAISVTRSGGLVGYTTCSLHPRETEEIIEFVSQIHSFEIIDGPNLLPMVPMETGPYIKLWPHRHGTDGMFMAILEVS